MEIRTATQGDADAIWQILEPMIRAGDTYTLPRDMNRDDALAYWMAPTHEVFVAFENDGMVGTYFLQVNQQGGGSHVCNCGYVTAQQAMRRGVATAMCKDSLERAAARGFLGMQFNFVLSTNVRAVELWQRLGFDIVGRLPNAFLHPNGDYVDALVMYRTLPKPISRAEHNEDVPYTTE